MLFYLLVDIYGVYAKYYSLMPVSIGIDAAAAAEFDRIERVEFKFNFIAFPEFFFECISVLTVDSKCFFLFCFHI